jgi:hypothetical protein
VIDVNCLNRGLNSVKEVHNTFFVTVNTLLTMFGSGFKPNRRSNLSDANIFCPRVCNRVCNSRVGNIFDINDLLPAFVAFTATTKVGVNRFYQSSSSIFFTFRSG